MLSIPQFLLLIIVLLVCLNKFRESIDIRPWFSTSRSVREAVALVTVERLIDLVELLLWPIRSSLLNDTFTHEYGVVVGGVLDGCLTVLDIANPLDRVPMQSLGISLSDTRAKDLKFVLC